MAINKRWRPQKGLNMEKKKEERKEIWTLVLAIVATDASGGLKVSFQVISPKKPTERLPT